MRSMTAFTTSGFDGEAWSLPGRRARPPDRIGGSSVVDAHGNGS
jgi:hypothetical protein